MLLAPLFAPFPSFPWFCGATTSTGTLISSTLPSDNLSVTLATSLPKADVVGFSILITSTSFGKFTLDNTSWSVKVSPCLTETNPLTNRDDKSNASTSLIAASSL